MTTLEQKRDIVERAVKDSSNPAWDDLGRVIADEIKRRISINTIVRLSEIKKEEE